MAVRNKIPKTPKTLRPINLNPSPFWRWLPWNLIVWLHLYYEDFIIIVFKPIYMVDGPIPIMPFSSDDVRSAHYHSSWRSSRTFDDIRVSIEAFQCIETRQSQDETVPEESQNCMKGVISSRITRLRLMIIRFGKRKYSQDWRKCSEV